MPFDALSGLCLESHAAPVTVQILHDDTSSLEDGNSEPRADVLIGSSFWKLAIHSPGRNFRSGFVGRSNISGSPLSRFASAEKSAQIISRLYLRDLSAPPHQSPKASIDVVRLVPSKSA